MRWGLGWRMTLVRRSIFVDHLVRKSVATFWGDLLNALSLRYLRAIVGVIGSLNWGALGRESYSIFK
jgi:hypothetical protein